MARFTVDEFSINGAHVSIEFDSGGPVGGDHLVIVTNGDVYSDDPDSWIVNRWFYFDEFNESYARNFAEKVATDDEYRTACLEGTADWVRVSQIYDEAAREIYQFFVDAGVMGFAAGDREEKRVHEEAKAALEEICEDLFNGIKARIRSPETIPNDALDITEFVDDKKDEAFHWLQEQGHIDSSLD